MLLAIVIDDDLSSLGYLGMVATGACIHVLLQLSNIRMIR